ncbi:hypothetical protein Cgig2_005573 [Carnegiea gigantea]|uniref:Protein kinase domain-containing protein n=1 Tax=Carnegiea gigantea TaxID=171969 RepID=A0A9Q1QQ32_9CARY|nr:hypothetical protein Cgig2_005573 [Carnegiea gigantea]
MELNPEDVKSFLTVNELSCGDTFGKTFKGHIPAENPYGLKEMDVAVKVSHNRTLQTCDQDLETMSKNVLKLSHLRHKNIIDLVGYSTSPDHFYLVHKLVPGRRLADILEGEDFVPIIVDLKHCVEGRMHAAGSGTPGYYSSKKGGATSKNDDVLAFGILALQLIVKDLRIAFTVEEGSKLSLHHTLDKYVRVFRERGDFAHPSYGEPEEARKGRQPETQLLPCTAMSKRIPTGFGIPEQNVAIKKSHPKDCENAEHLELKAQYQNELNLGMFEHKNIVKLIGYDESEKHFYLVYERVEGTVLEELIEGEISWTNALKVLMGLASALRYLQNHLDGPFVERVVSLLQDGTPKLIDFGLCVAVGEKKLGVHQGYFFREKEGLASLASDVFSFGVVAVHLLAKDSRNYFKNSYGLPEPIVNFYINQFQERAGIVSREFGDPKEAIHVSQVIVSCLRMDNLPNIGEVWSQLKQLLRVNMYFLVRDLPFSFEENISSDLQLQYSLALYTADCPIKLMMGQPVVKLGTASPAISGLRRLRLRGFAYLTL